jgi:hypothetical protein
MNTNEILVNFSGVTFKTTYEYITPDRAKELLSNSPTSGNRTIRKAVVNRYADDMKNGVFIPLQAISLTSNNLLLDGYHRLHAIIESGCTILCQVNYDVPEEWMKHLDQGALRTPADYLQFEGVKYAPLTSGGVRRCMALKSKHVAIAPTENKKGFSKRYSNYSVVEEYHAHEDLYNLATSITMGVREYIPLMSTSIHGLISYLLIVNHHSEEEVRGFFEKLAGVTPIDPTKPGEDSIQELEQLLKKVTFKRRLGEKKTNRWIQDRVVYVWNAYISGKKIGKLERISNMNVTKIL